MPRPTPHLDRARELLGELNAALELPDDDLAELATRQAMIADCAVVEAHLAIAEALHGVVYVANANAV